MGNTLPTSLPHLITGSGEESDVSLDRPVRGKRVSQDSGVSSRYERALSEVFSVMDLNDDSGIVGHLCVCVCVCVHVYTCTCMCMCTCMCTCMCVYTCACMYLHVHVYTVYVHISCVCIL